MKYGKTGNNFIITPYENISWDKSADIDHKVLFDTSVNDFIWVLFLGIETLHVMCRIRD